MALTNSFDNMVPITTLTISNLVGSEMLPLITHWCIMNGVNYSVKFKTFDIDITMDIDNALMVKLKFPI